jgi:hypothetical protein
MIAFPQVLLDFQAQLRLEIGFEIVGQLSENPIAVDFYHIRFIRHKQHHALDAPMPKK